MFVSDKTCAHMSLVIFGFMSLDLIQSLGISHVIADEDDEDGSEAVTDFASKMSPADD